MAAYQINEKTYRANNHWEALNDALLIAQEGVDMSLYTYQVKGKVVTRDEFLAACHAAWDAAKEKKNTTHKLIWVHQGASNAQNTWHQVWVKR